MQIKTIRYHLLLFSHPVVSDSFVTLWAVACQTSLSMGFSKQEHWSGLPCSPPGIFPAQELNPCLLPWQADSLPLSQWGRPIYHYIPIKMTNIWNTDNGKY